MTTTTTILAWHGDPALKTAAVKRMREHAAAADAAAYGWWTWWTDTVITTIKETSSDR